ncbi:MAG: hypothetical protein IKI34_00365 [Eubacterium sp.]|nr:hypothetical protein [Eubacterium sp.]MBR7060176.1 hypothetical protein [Eubacterium sp.]
MKVFLIILAVLAVIIGIILSLSAEFTVVFDNGWSTKVRVLFWEWDIQLSKLLSFVLFPDKAAEQKKAEKAEKSVEKKEEIEEKTEEISQETEDNSNNEKKPEKKQKPNYIQKILNEDGVVGLMLLISNLIQTANSALTTLIKGLHIYSLYVKMIIGGGDAADIGEKFGEMCGFYYPIKGFVLNSMKVDMYDDFIQPDFIAPRSEYEFQIIASLNVALLLKVGLKAAKVFLVNLIKNK